jgi:hypothetical protein
MGAASTAREWRKAGAVSLAVVAIALVLASCGGGSNLPSVSRSPAVPSRTAVVTRTATPPTEGPTSSGSTPTSTSTSTATKTSTSTETETSTSTSTATQTSTSTSTATATSTGSGSTTKASSSEPSASSGTTWWPWLLLALVVIAGIVAYVLRRRSGNAAAADAHRRALDAYASAMALHDEAAVLPMSAEGDRAGMLRDVSANLDLVAGQFDALATEPAMREVSAEIEQVQLALGSLRGSIQAQVGAGGVDADLLRDRLADLNDSLQGFRRRLSPTTP